jgi:hypothetical protein
MVLIDMYFVEILSAVGRRISFQVIYSSGIQDSVELNAFVTARAGVIFWGEGATFKVWKGIEVPVPKGFNV